MGEFVLVPAQIVAGHSHGQVIVVMRGEPSGLYPDGLEYFATVPRSRLIEGLSVTDLDDAAKDNIDLSRQLSAATARAAELEATIQSLRPTTTEGTD